MLSVFLFNDAFLFAVEGGAALLNKRKVCFYFEMFIFFFKL